MNPQAVTELFFELFKCQDKALRKFLFAYIVSDIKNINTKKKDPQLNKVRYYSSDVAFNKLTYPFNTGLKLIVDKYTCCLNTLLLSICIVLN